MDDTVFEDRSTEPLVCVALLPCLSAFGLRLPDRTVNKSLMQWVHPPFFIVEAKQLKILGKALSPEKESHSEEEYTQVGDLGRDPGRVSMAP